MRKLILLFFMTLALLLGHNAQAAQNVVSPEKRVVVLDAGHGGIRSGAHYNKISEKDINLAVAKETKRQLAEKMPELEVYLTRESDTQLHDDKTTDNRNRAKFANSKGADLFVSIHADAASSSSALGPTVYLLSFDDKLLSQNRNMASRFVDDDDMLNIQDISRSSMGYIIALSNQMNNDPMNHVFANILNTEFKAHKRNAHTIKYNIWTVLYWLEGPGALVELGYMTNPEELAYMNSAKGQAELSDALSDAIVQFIKNLNAMQQYTEMGDASEQTESTEVQQSQPSQPSSEESPAAADASGEGYAIQLLSSKTELSIDDSQFKAYRGRVAKVMGEGTYKYKYCLCGYKSRSDAQADLEEVRKSFKDAYVVYYEAGCIVKR